MEIDQLAVQSVIDQKPVMEIDLEDVQLSQSSSTEVSSSLLKLSRVMRL